MGANTPCLPVSNAYNYKRLKCRQKIWDGPKHIFDCTVHKWHLRAGIYLAPGGVNTTENVLVHYKCCSPIANIIRPPGTTVPDGLIFCPRCFFFSPRFLRDPSTDRPETLPHDRKQAGLNKLTSKIRGVLPQNNLGAKNMQNFGQFWTTSDFDREYLRNGWIYPKSADVTNYGNSSCV